MRVQLIIIIIIIIIIISINNNNNNNNITSLPAGCRSTANLLLQVQP
jgi:hypothetical protein